MQQLGYSIIGDKTPIRVNKLSQNESLNWLEDQNEPIKMHFPIDLENKFLEQSKATKHVVKYLKEVFENELENFEFAYEIVDVSSGDNKFTISIPYSSTRNTNHVMKVGLMITFD